jgi:hypothetical protein
MDTIEQQYAKSLKEKAQPFIELLESRGYPSTCYVPEGEDDLYWQSKEICFMYYLWKQANRPTENLKSISKRLHGYMSHVEEIPLLEDASTQTVWPIVLPEGWTAIELEELEGLRKSHARWEAAKTQGIVYAGTHLTGEEAEEFADRCANKLPMPGGACEPRTSEDLYIPPEAIFVATYPPIGKSSWVARPAAYVRVVHLPSGISTVGEISDHNQHTNKAEAMRLLREELFTSEWARKNPEIAFRKKGTD